jgi:phosphate uptake regulator
MTPDSSENSSSPVVHSGHIRRQLTGVIDHLNADLTRVDDLRFRALLEVAAEMLKGVRTAFAQYDEGREKSIHLSE